MHGVDYIYTYYTIVTIIEASTQPLPIIKNWQPDTMRYASDMPTRWVHELRLKNRWMRGVRLKHSNSYQLFMISFLICNTLHSWCIFPFQHYSVTNINRKAKHPMNVWDLTQSFSVILWYQSYSKDHRHFFSHGVHQRFFSVHHSDKSRPTTTSSSSSQSQLPSQVVLRQLSLMAYPAASIPSGPLFVWICWWHNPLPTQDDYVCHHYRFIFNSCWKFSLHGMVSTRQTHSECLGFHTFWINTYSCGESWNIWGCLAYTWEDFLISIKSQDYALEISTGHPQEECSLHFRLLPKSLKPCSHSCC